VKWQSLCRADDSLLESLRQGRDLGRVGRSAITAICLGGAAYGIAFGAWRGPVQAAYSAVKLPALFLAVAVCTVGLGGMFALLLRSRLSLAQTWICMLVSFAVTAIVLLALAPVGMAFALLVPPPDPHFVGLSPSDPRLATAHAVGKALLLMHTAAVAAAGTIGVARLRDVLLGLGLELPVARRVLTSWIAAQFCVGSQLSWLFRPFLGAAEATPTFLPDHALRGSFFEAVAQSATSTFGPAAPLVFVAAGVVATTALVQTFREESAWAKLEVEIGGLVVTRHLRRRVLPWSRVATVTSAGVVVKVALAPDETLGVERFQTSCASEADAQALCRLISAASLDPENGPFRRYAYAPQG
jgi:hypothetical protein